MRLIAQKNSTAKHKKILSERKTKTQTYGLHYTAAPGKSYLIEPKDGELNYDLAYRNPTKFYNRVMTQKVTQHKV